MSEVDSVQETGQSTAVNVTQQISAVALMNAGAQAALQAGARPTYQQRLRNDMSTRAPLMYASGNITGLDGYEEHGAALSSTVSAFTAMEAAVNSIIDARKKSAQHPEMVHSEAMQVLAVATVSEKHMEAASRKADAAMAHLSSQIAAIEQDLNKSVLSGAHSALAVEIRAHVKSQKAPVGFIGQLIAAGDEQSVSAVLGAPGYLSGIDEKVKATLVRQWNERRQPQLSAKLKLLQAASDKLERAGANLVLAVERGMGVSWDLVKRLRDAKAAASF